VNFNFNRNLLKCITLVLSMKLLDKLREALEGNQSKIKIRGEVSGTNWAEIKMTNVTGEPIRLGTPVIDMKIGIQTLTSGASDFSAQEYRVDNAHHGSLHAHSGSVVFPLKDKTMSGSLLAFFGKDYAVLENQSL
jgi:hypothetical protein